MMRLIYIIILLFVGSCSSSPEGNTEISFDTKLKKIWEKIKSNDISAALDDIESNLKLTKETKDLSRLHDAKGWTYYLSANGLKDDPKYKQAMGAFLLSEEFDSDAGKAIVGQLIESYSESLKAAEKFLTVKSYAHKYSLKAINLPAVLVNGAWSAYFLKNWGKAKEFLDKYEPEKKHDEIPDSLIADLKKIVL